jgi:hypothetical protein
MATKTKKKRPSTNNRIRDAVRNWTTLSSSERLEMAGEFLAEYPLTSGEREIFVQSPKRVDKILAVEKYRDARIVARIVASDACIAGHGIGDTITFDSMGRLLTAAGDKPVCIRLLNRIWYRLIMILDRMADDRENTIGKGDFTGEVIDVRMNCYGAPFPYGDCGQVLMEFSVEGLE